VVARDEDVGGLHVAVDEAGRVGRVERRRHLRHDRRRPLRRQRALVLEQPVQVGARHVAHDQVELAVLLARPVHRHDVRVVDQRREPRLALEALAEGRVGRAVGGDQLERNRAPEVELDRPVDDAHAAAPRDRFDAEITEDVTRSERCHAIHCDRAN
jgi:hypothetical protein